MKTAKPRTWSNMKLGAVFNFWDGEENLLAVVESVRPHVDFLGLVWSAKSVFGEARSQDELISVGKYIKPAKFDEVVRYEPKGSAIEGDKQKRNQAIDLCKAFQCTHFISLDADDFVSSESFAMLKADTIEHDYETTAAVTILNGSRISEFTPLIYRLDDRRFGRCRAFPVQAIFSRRLETTNTARRRIYLADEIRVAHNPGNRATEDGAMRAARNSLYLRHDV